MLGDVNSKDFEEIVLAADKFRKKYSLKPLDIFVKITKEGDEINKHFEIYPRNKGKIEGISPINLNSSHIENLLLDTEEEVILRIDNNLYHIKKNNLDFKN